MNIYVFSHVALECAATRWLTHRAETIMSVKCCCQQSCVFMNSSLKGCKRGNVYPLAQWCNSDKRLSWCFICHRTTFTEACFRAALLLADLAVLLKNAHRKRKRQEKEKDEKETPRVFTAHSQKRTLGFTELMFTTYRLIMHNIYHFVTLAFNELQTLLTHYKYASSVC